MAERRARKTLDIDSGLLEQVRRSLGVGTDREAVTYALEQVSRQLRGATLMRKFYGIGPLDAARIED
jgi:Arc/MetJ family transcription regulator